MKKIIFAVGVLILIASMAKSIAFADEIIDANGTITPCKIVTVVGGFIEYKKDGNLNKFAREKDSLIFNDYVDVRGNIFKKNSGKRYFGKIVIKDIENVRMITENADVVIPSYKIKFIGVYKPDSAQVIPAKD